MNWSVLAALGSFGTLLVAVIGFMYTAGKLSQQLATTAKDIIDHRGRLDEHEVRLSANDVAIGRLEEWKSGFNAAAAVKGNGQIS